MARRRKNGTGTVRKRADGRWEGRVVTGYDDNGLPKTKNVLGKTKKECLEELKVFQEQYTPPIRFHDLRHTFATHALTSGVDAKTLSTILGHTNASFTLDTYTHMTTDMHRKAAAVVGGFLDEIM